MNQSIDSESDKLRIAFIKAGWHQDIVDEGYKGFIQELERLTTASAVVDVFDVPGAFEIPLLAQDLAKTGRFSAIVCCGFVVDGGIYRHEFVADAVISGLMQTQLETGVPVLSVVLTPQSFHETNGHRRFFLDHFKVKGQETANACVSILNTRRSLVA